LAGTLVPAIFLLFPAFSAVDLDSRPISNALLLDRN
jgi:hypothetical protein